MHQNPQDALGSEPPSSPSPFVSCRGTKGTPPASHTPPVLGRGTGAPRGASPRPPASPRARGRGPGRRRPRAPRPGCLEPPARSPAGRRAGCSGAAPARFSYWLPPDGVIGGGPRESGAKVPDFRPRCFSGDEGGDRRGRGIPRVDERPPRLAASKTRPGKLKKNNKKVEGGGKKSPINKSPSFMAERAFGERRR